MTVYTAEQTVRYKTYLKLTMQNALALVFANHPDPLLQTQAAAITPTDADPDPKSGTKVTLEFPLTKSRFPAVVIRYYERDISNAGVGHQEYIEIPVSPGSSTLVPWLFNHYLYEGDLEFALYGLSSLDRDLMADTLVNVITMGRLGNWSNYLFSTLYNVTGGDGLGNFVTLNTDKLQGFGESTAPTPWNAENEKLYTVSYRVGVLGEFYSLPPANPTGGYVTAINPFFWDPLIGETQPTGSNDPAPWV